jgi:hypothetical protein
LDSRGNGAYWIILTNKGRWFIRPTDDNTEEEDFTNEKKEPSTTTSVGKKKIDREQTWQFHDRVNRTLMLAGMYVPLRVQPKDMVANRWYSSQHYEAHQALPITLHDLEVDWMTDQKSVSGGKAKENAPSRLLLAHVAKHLCIYNQALAKMYLLLIFVQPFFPFVLYLTIPLIS